MFQFYNCNNVMMNITKYKLFPTFLINGRGIITGTSGIKIFEFLGIYYKIAFHKDELCLKPFYQQSSHVPIWKYFTILPFQETALWKEFFLGQPSEGN